MIDKFILGSAQLGMNYGVTNRQGMPSEALALNILSEAYKAGIRTLDTASAYGKSEQIISLYHQLFPDQMFNLNTKIVDDEFRESDKIIPETISRLRVTKINTLFVHRYRDNRELGFFLDKFQKFKCEGLIEQIGVSIYTNEEAENVASMPIVDVVQLPFNALDNLNLRGAIIKLLKEKGKKIQIRSIFLQGLLATRIELPEKIKPLENSLSRLQEIALHSNRTLPQLAIDYVMGCLDIDHFLFGVDNKDQLINNLEMIKSYRPLEQEILKDIYKVETPNILLDPRKWN